MDIYNSCISGKEISVSTIQQCFENGHKLAVLTSREKLTDYYIPNEWELLDIRGEYIILFPNTFTALLFKKICDIHNVGYDWIKKPTLQGDIIHLLFFGYCIFDIAEEVFSNLCLVKKMQLFRMN